MQGQEGALSMAMMSSRAGGARYVELWGLHPGGATCSVRWRGAVARQFVEGDGGVKTRHTMRRDVRPDAPRTGAADDGGRGRRSTLSLAESKRRLRLAKTGRRVIGIVKNRAGGLVATVRQYLQSGLDRFPAFWRLAPVVLGQGEALFCGLDLPALGFSVTEHKAYCALRRTLCWRKDRRAPAGRIPDRACLPRFCVKLAEVSKRSLPCALIVCALLFSAHRFRPPTGDEPIAVPEAHASTRRVSSSPLQGRSLECAAPRGG